jgi:predicted protein tyrosine phosphatase
MEVIRFIENISKSDCRNGIHYDPGPNSMLIQISDPPGDYPTPKFKFKEIHQFDFLDEDRPEEEFVITDEQAKRLVDLLARAYDNHMNVVVHCHAGICRSGAVVEVASRVGFTPTDRYRLPNVLVKHKMLKVLGLTYDSIPDEMTGAELARMWFDGI